MAVVAGSFIPVQWKIALGTTTLETVHAQTGSVTLEHRLWHYVAFGVSIWLLLLPETKRWREFYIVACVMVLGLAIELLQHLIFGNRFEWWDMRDDWVGIIITFIGRQWWRDRSPNLEL
jgi:hypothetical protein